MTDPNQNSPQNPGGQEQNPYASSGGSGRQSRPWQTGGPQDRYGHPGPGAPQQNMYGQPGQPGGGKAVAIIVGGVVVIVVIAAVLFFALRSDDDGDDDGTAAGQPVTSAPLDDTLTDGDGYGDPGSTGNGLSPQWVSLVPSGIADHLEGCHDTSFNVHYVDENSGAFEVDGITCHATGTALDYQQVDILSNSERVSYLEDAVDGNQEATTARVFRQDGPVTVGIANVESTDPTLYYLDSSSDLSVEIMTFDDAGSARAAAGELGIL